MTEIYLGESVFVSFDGRRFCVDYRGEEMTHRIYLSANVVDRLHKYATKQITEDDTAEPPAK